jgi:hypothetical protein
MWLIETFSFIQQKQKSEDEKRIRRLQRTRNFLETWKYVIEWDIRKFYIQLKNDSARLVFSEIPRENDKLDFGIGKHVPGRILLAINISMYDWFLPTNFLLEMKEGNPIGQPTRYEHNNSFLSPRKKISNSMEEIITLC